MRPRGTKFFFMVPRARARHTGDVTTPAAAPELRCPSCQGDLVPLQIEDIRCHACRGCGGLWFQVPVLEDLLGDLFDLEALLAATVPGTTPRRCPRCHESMTAHRTGAASAGAGQGVEVDHCVACASLWLDPEELGALQARERPSLLRPRPVATPPLATLAHYQTVDMAEEVDRRSIAWSTYFFCLFTQMPVEVHAPRRVFPSGVLLLVLACLGVFTFEWSLPESNLARMIRDFGLVPALFPGSAYQLLTHPFLHASPGHLLGNLYFLWIFGDNVHDVFRDHGPVKGPACFLLFYLTAAVVGGLLHAVIASTRSATAEMSLVGASGAVSGVMAAYWRLFPRSRLYQTFLVKAWKIPLWFYFGSWLLMNLATGAALGPYSSVSWQAHLGGFLCGYLLLELFLPYRLSRWRGPTR